MQVLTSGGAHKLFEKCLVVTSHGLVGKSLLDRQVSAVAERLPQGWIGDQSLDGSGESRRIRRLDHHSVFSIFNDFRNAANTRRHNRLLTSHGFDNDNAKWFGFRWKYKDRATGEQFRHFQ